MIKELEICAEIEETVSQIYQYLAELEPAGSDLRYVWEEMARDELDHARLLRFAERLDPENTYDGYSINEEEAQLLLVEVTQARDLIQLQTLSVREAVTTMLSLEEKFQKVHARYAIKCKEESMQETFNRLGKGDESHVARLKEIAQPGN